MWSLHADHERITQAFKDVPEEQMLQISYRRCKTNDFVTTFIRHQELLATVKKQTGLVQFMIWHDINKSIFQGTL